MTDDKMKAAPQDAKPISLTEAYDIAYGTKKFGITDDRLTEAVYPAGDAPAAVVAYLQK